MKTLTGIVDLPEWVVIETATLHRDCRIGRIIEVWRNQIKVEYAVPEDSIIRSRPAIGVYTVSRNIIRAPELHDWILHAQRLGDL